MSFVLFCVLKDEFRETGFSEVILHEAGTVEETLDLNIFYASLFLYCKIVTICLVDT